MRTQSLEASLLVKPRSLYCSFALLAALTVATASGVARCAMAVGPTGDSPRTAGTSDRSATTTSGGYRAGDLHSHTWLSPDGAHTEGEIVQAAFSTYGLDWLCATDHGGPSVHNPDGTDMVGTAWMWKTIRDVSWPIVLDARRA